MQFLLTALFLFVVPCVHCFPRNKLHGFTQCSKIELFRKPVTALLAVAPFKQPRKQNAPGNLFVDESCIDCDVCRWMCPSVFGRVGIKSAVLAQPSTEQEKLQAYAAMITCPVGSIRTQQPDSLTKIALDLFPAEINPDKIPGVFHLGYHSAESFGATPYFIKRKEGNVMIDSPRFNSRYSFLMMCIIMLVFS